MRKKDILKNYKIIIALVGLNNIFSYGDFIAQIKLKDALSPDSLFKQTKNFNEYDLRHIGEISLKENEIGQYYKTKLLTSYDSLLLFKKPSLFSAKLFINSRTDLMDNGEVFKLPIVYSEELKWRHFNNSILNRNLILYGKYEYRRDDFGLKIPIGDIIDAIRAIVR